MADNNHDDGEGRVAVAGRDTGAGRAGGAAPRHHNYYRPTILVLLKQQPSHGYELAARMAGLGFSPAVVDTVYKVLRDMEHEELIASYWEVDGRGGPPRRVYALTAGGEESLADSLPALARQRHALDAVLDLHTRLEGHELGTPA